MDSEKVIEARLRTEVKRLEGRAIKWVSPGNNGVPDRIVLMPGGQVWFLELKSTGLEPSPLQVIWLKTLRKLGFKAYWFDTLEELEYFILEVESTLKGDLNTLELISQYRRDNYSKNYKISKYGI